MSVIFYEKGETFMERHPPYFYNENDSDVPLTKDGKKIMCLTDMCKIVTHESEQQQDDSIQSTVQEQAELKPAPIASFQEPNVNESIRQLNTLFNHAFNPTIDELDQLRAKLQESGMTIKEVPKLAPYNLMNTFIHKMNVITFAGKIYIYNGHYYAESSTDDVRSLLMAMFRDDIKDCAPSLLNSVVDYIRIEPEIRITDDDIRTDIISFNNGVLNLATKQLMPHHPQYITMYSIQANYIPSGICNSPNFDNYLLMLTGNDPCLIERIYQSIGYILSPDLRGKVIFLLQGVSGSGKSVLTNFLERLFTLRSFYPIQADKLKGQFALAEMCDRALCVMPDMPNEALDAKAVSVLKTISGSDLISSDVKFKSAVSFRCRAKFIMTTNFAVISKTPDDAFYARLLCIPCRYSVPRSEQNLNLIDHLFEERDAIVSKAMYAYFRLVENHHVFAGNYPPNSCIDFNGGYSEDLSMNIFNFALSYYEIDPEGVVFTDDAYELYSSRNPSIARNYFSEVFKKTCAHEFETKDGRRYKKYINERGEEVKSSNALRCILGIKLKSSI